MLLEPIDLRQIDKVAANVYEAIIVAGKKARILNDQTKQEFNERVGYLESVNNTPEDDGEDLDNPEKAKISMEFEKRSKPHIRALNTLLKGEVEFEYKDQK